MSALLQPPSLATSRQKLLLDADSNGLLMSPEEFLSIGANDTDSRFRYELIHGVVIVSPAVSNAEADPNEDLGCLLRRYQDEHPQGSVLDYTAYERDVRVGDNIRRCDRAIWIGLGRQPEMQTDVPSIVVEFVSPGRRSFLRDYVEKRQEYLTAGIQEYWVINRFTRSMHVFVAPLSDDREIVLEELDTYTTPLLPGFELPIRRIMAKAVRWDKSQD